MFFNVILFCRIFKNFFYCVSEGSGCFSLIMFHRMLHIFSVVLIHRVTGFHCLFAHIAAMLFFFTVFNKFLNGSYFYRCNRFFVVIGLHKLQQGFDLYE